MPKSLPVQLQELEAKPEKTTEDLARIEELKAKIANKSGGGDNSSTKFKEGESDFVDYQRFASFYHLMWDKKQKRFLRKKLKEGVLKEFDKLEKKFKDYPGHKPKFTKTVFLEAGISNARIVKDYAVPESLYNQFKDAKKSNHYF